MQRVREESVRLLTWEIGKTRADSEKEFDRTVQYVLDTVEALKELDRAGSRFSSSAGILAQIRRAPLGVVLCMGPFNYPLNETFTTLIPALIMGNTVVVKLPRYGMLCQAPLLQAFAASFPPGVVNVVNGEGRTVAGPLVETGELAALAFIGSSRVANVLKKQHPRPNRLRCILGLDAKNPAIVLPDADLELAVRECVAGALSFNGQRCTALKLVYVHRSLAERFLQQLSDAVDALPFGMPWEPGVRLTPLPEEGKPETLARLVADALAKGARVVNANGGLSRGTFYFPAVVYPVDRTMALHGVEQFGPVLPVAPFDDVREVVDEIVASDFGQQASVFGRDAARRGAARGRAGEPGLPRQPERAVPARAGRLPVHGPQGQRGGDALRLRRPALLLHPLDGGRARRAGEPHAAPRRAGRAFLELREHRLPVLSGPQPTTSTSFCVPNPFATRRSAAGLLRHWPSTSSRYWCSPGASVTVAAQQPSRRRLRRTPSADQPVKSPVTWTSLASSPGTTSVVRCLLIASSSPDVGNGGSSGGARRIERLNVPRAGGGVKVDRGVDAPQNDCLVTKLPPQIACASQRSKAAANASMSRRVTSATGVTK